jgi:hypothetical protein
MVGDAVSFRIFVISGTAGEKNARQDSRHGGFPSFHGIPLSHEKSIPNFTLFCFA